MSTPQEGNARLLLATIVATALIMAVAAIWAVQGPTAELSAALLAILG
jgi:hypothetical protein